ncbi:hypothetical protein QUA41_31035 [Microcoleus sp. Pol11C1]|uniref:hypothetical protein n=1 Tax=unclassified Microcoleus TaxID=2642155 RepID=UPI002FD38F95
MNNSEALAQLRFAVARFDRSEKLALAAFLTAQCNPRFVSVTHTAEPVFGENLDAALEATGYFPQEAKLAFAIELLQFCRDEDEGDYKGEVYFASDRPALGDEDD